MKNMAFVVLRLVFPLMLEALRLIRIDQGAVIHEAYGVVVSVVSEELETFGSLPAMRPR